MALPSKVQSASTDEICADVVKAARDVLKRHGIERPSIVVNFAWKDDGMGPWAVGTAVSNRHRDIMSSSLAQSAEEAGYEF